MRLFVSHIHEEAPLAMAIKAELLNCFGNQIDIFLAEDIPLGTNWLNEIQGALTQAQIVVVLFSRASSTRPWINIEAGYGVMAGKKVLPLCHSGFGKSELPVIYGLLQAMDVANAVDAGRLLDQIAQNTPAGRLLADRPECIRRWIEKVSEACLLTPAGHSSFHEPPCVWIVGSNRGLPNKQAETNKKFTSFLAHAMVHQGFRAVFGRSGLLDQLGTTMVAESTRLAEVDKETLTQFAHASAMLTNSDNAPPNPVVVLGSTRAKRGPRSIFLDSIGRIPDVVVTLGGSPSGRTPEEVAIARSAQIPLLPLHFTGGYSAREEHSFSKMLNKEIAQLQSTKRDYASAAQKVCELIAKQTEIGRAQ
jgi:hypothetical protein